ncbi:glucose-1-phosphate adenylyltransferase [Portibacter lacus]|uniref:Glucose-1-phosphate adenylyltransferase n=1 Tax=Portibacter lacus TaxID=1099794 RepID=A0AA37SRQ1_9BACT|nr:glucose-1-phosphate adenylyltransferase [Portibacter lacus]GLR18772.1 glucose-1-phosphate adenylyltransferase [Portibacter lacus]
MTDKTISVILGGGAGTRLFPLTKDRSKPAVPLGGKYRLIDIPLSNCLNSNLRRIFVLTQFNSASLNKHVTNAYHFDVFSKGFVDILAAEQTRENENWFQGTADAVRQVMPRINHHDHEHIIILSGDQLYQMDLKSIIKHHVKTGADVTIGTIPVNSEDAPGFGIMKVDSEDNINDFIEKPSADILDQWVSPLDEKYTSEGKNYLASMGIYVFTKKALANLFSDIPGATDFGKEYIPHAVNNSKYKVASFPFGGYWSDIGTIKSYYSANLMLNDFLPEFNMYSNQSPLYSRARMLAPSKFFGTIVNSSLISEGCILHAREIDNSVIGIRSRIGPRTLVKDSIVFGNDYYQKLQDISEESQQKLLGIGKDCVIDKAIIEKNVKIGNFVEIIGHESLEDSETDTHCIRDGIVVVKKGAVILDNTKIGYGA